MEFLFSWSLDPCSFLSDAHLFFCFFFVSTLTCILLTLFFFYYLKVYAEAYTCTCVRYHPYGSCFIAQSNGNYIAVFSARLPYKLDKYKRYENHGVWGFPIKCNFSMDGQQIASGSSDGCIYLYDYKSSNLLKKIKAFDQACVDVAFHPAIPDVIASCSWTGEISVFG